MIRNVVAVSLLCLAANGCTRIPSDEMAETLILGTWIRTEEFDGAQLYAETTYNRDRTASGYAERQSLDVHGHKSSVERIENEFKWTIESGVITVFDHVRKPHGRYPPEVVLKQELVRLDHDTFEVIQLKSGQPQLWSGRNS